MYHQNSQIAPPKVTITRPKSATIVAPATDIAITIKDGKQGLLVGQLSGFSRTTQGSKTARIPGRTQPSATEPPSFFAIPTPPPTRSKQRPKSSNRSIPPAKVFASGIAPSEHFIASPRAILSGSHDHNMETNLNLLAHTEVPSLSSLTPVTASATITGNVYHAMAARKAAEDTVKQLARRIAHYRAQEERVLREVHEVKSKLETVLVTTQQQQQALPLGDYHLPVQVWTTPTGRPAGSKQPRREPNTQRSRDQLQFLTKQKKLLQLRKHESAKHQKEKRKVALTSQKMKEEAEKQQKTTQKERIRQEYQRALEERTAKQHHLLEILDGQHRERLTMEKEREDHALDLIEQMREEETQLALRLQALKFHHEFIKRGLDGTSP